MHNVALLNMMKRISIIMILLLSVANVQATDKEEQESYLEEARRLYEELMKGDKDLSEETKRWIKEDLKNIGNWEYKTVLVPHRDIKKTEEKLNELGKERWECFWIEQHKDGLVLFFKKPKISYLQKIPTGNLLRFLQKTDGN